MDEIEIIDNFKKDIGIKLKDFVLKARSGPFYVHFEDKIPLGRLGLRGGALYFEANERFKSYSKPISDLLNDDELINIVDNLCSLFVKIEKSTEKKNSNSIEIQEKVYHELMQDPNRDYIILYMKELFGEDLIILRLMNGSNLIREIRL